MIEKNLMLKHGKPIEEKDNIEVFNVFKLESLLETSLLLKEKLEIIKVLKLNYTKLFFKELDYRIQEKQSLTLAIHGGLNSGLTTIANKIAEYIKKSQKRITNRNVKIYNYISDGILTAMEYYYNDNNSFNFFQVLFADILQAEAGAVFIIPDYLTIPDRPINHPLYSRIINSLIKIRANELSFIIPIHNPDNLSFFDKSIFMKLETAGKDHHNFKNRVILYLEEGITTKLKKERKIWKPEGFIVL